jgi:hypothetical protein
MGWLSVPSWDLIHIQLFLHCEVKPRSIDLFVTQLLFYKINITLSNLFKKPHQTTVIQPVGSHLLLAEVSWPTARNWRGLNGLSWWWNSAQISFLVAEWFHVSNSLFFLWLYSPIKALAAYMKLSVSFQLLDLGQTVGLLGRVISSSLCLCTGCTKHRKTHTKHKH